ncbi:unnamed protein product [Caenorhabditis nigoni]
MVPANSKKVLCINYLKHFLGGQVPDPSMGLLFSTITPISIYYNYLFPKKLNIGSEASSCTTMPEEWLYKAKNSNLVPSQLLVLSELFILIQATEGWIVYGPSIAKRLSTGHSQSSFGF